jgi:hypothetical protein
MKPGQIPLPACLRTSEYAYGPTDASIWVLNPMARLFSIDNSYYAGNMTAAPVKFVWPTLAYPHDKLLAPSCIQSTLRVATERLWNTNQAALLLPAREQWARCVNPRTLSRRVNGLIRWWEICKPHSPLQGAAEWVILGLSQLAVILCGRIVATCAEELTTLIGYIDRASFGWVGEIARSNCPTSDVGSD